MDNNSLKMPEPVLTDKTVLVALGGNALAPGETTGDIHEQFALTRAALRTVMPFIRRGCRLAI
ncbi:MAG: hypothetical protein GH142_03305, partial [Dehalococcoidia bacterium]|nr:hypothetical protein [Dehalococcoidia bacterium]